MASKLGEKLLQQVEAGEAFSEDTVNAMIDSILKALPPLGEPYKYDTDTLQTMCVGYNKALRAVKETLLEAKAEL